MFLVIRVSGLVEYFNGGIFLHIIKVLNVKLCMMVLHMELYLFITLSVTFTCFKITAVSNNFTWKIHVLIRLSWNSVELLSISSKSWLYHYFLLSHAFKRENWHVSWFDQTFIVGFFKDAVQVMFFKLFMIIMFPGVSQFVPDLLTLFQGHRRVRTINCELFFRFLCTVVWTLYGPYIHRKYQPQNTFSVHRAGQPQVAMATRLPPIIPGCHPILQSGLWAWRQFAPLGRFQDSDAPSFCSCNHRKVYCWQIETVFSKPTLFPR